MTVKAFLEALNNNASIVIKESDNTQIAEFNRNSYKAIADKVLASEIDDIEILSKSAISVVLTLKEAPDPAPDSGNTTTEPTNPIE